MQKKENQKQKILLHNLFGLGLFVLALPTLWRFGGAKLALDEILPGQVTAAAKEPDSQSVGLFGIEDVQFEETPEPVPAAEVNPQEITQMQDFSYLKQNYYIVDSRTMLLPEDIDIPEALEQDFSIDTSVEGPKILIFHTHISEGFADSDMSLGKEEGIWGAGEYLKQLLEENYGIEVLHDAGAYDVVNGKGQITGAYERMEPPIREILEKYPSIQVCIDMHRDGVAEGTRLVTNINGKDCAQIMFFNGLCRLNQNGQAVPTPGLDNPYVKDNLAFSLQMQTQARTRYPGFTRKIYLNAYRFSLHMMPRSTLIEVGAQTNTKEEIHNAMEPLAEILASVILEQEETQNS